MPSHHRRRFLAIYLNLVPTSGLEPDPQRYEGCIPPANTSRANFGSPTWSRTTDILINSQTLYQLSYRRIKLVSVEGIEPSLLGPKPRVIPFHHTEKYNRIVIYFLIKVRTSKLTAKCIWYAVTILNWLRG